MKIDFSRLPLSSAAFSEKPMKFVDPEPKRFLSSVIDLIAIETGRRRAKTGRRRSSKTCSSMPMSGLHSGASGSGQRKQATSNYPICRFSRETTSSAK
jgi:hypothetical protein